MRWPVRKPDPYRWRRRYAIRPRRIGDRWIWLQAFAWRPFRPEEEPARDWRMIGLGVLVGFSERRVYTLPDGYTVACRLDYPPSLGAVPFIFKDWSEPMPKPRRAA